MKTSLLSLATAAILFASTAASAASPFDHNDPRRMSPPERARYEAALRSQRENERRLALERARNEAAQRRIQEEQQRRQAQEQRARLEAQRRAEQQQAAERARYEAQHRNDRHDDRRDYHGR
ncbi:hypothetical protein [Hymenobacter rubidus]|uniref:hypothetical protein n=1 Tax=Hymenobacter rubidus TaxID=1441626 RepID=UPI00191CC0CF|nr:hypothetical protein [Hymenobacter rubidus]